MKNSKATKKEINLLAKLSADLEMLNYIEQGKQKELDAAKALYVRAFRCSRQQKFFNPTMGKTTFAIRKEWTKLLGSIYGHIKYMVGAKEADKITSQLSAKHFGQYKNI